MYDRYNTTYCGYKILFSKRGREGERSIVLLSQFSKGDSNMENIKLCMTF